MLNFQVYYFVSFDPYMSDWSIKYLVFTFHILNVKYGRSAAQSQCYFCFTFDIIWKDYITLHAIIMDGFASKQTVWKFKESTEKIAMRFSKYFDSLDSPGKKLRFINDTDPSVIKGDNFT